MVFRAVLKTAPRGGAVVEHFQRGHQLDRLKGLTGSGYQFDYIKSLGLRATYSRVLAYGPWDSLGFGLLDLVSALGAGSDPISMPKVSLTMIVRDYRRPPARSENETARIGRPGQS